MKLKIRNPERLKEYFLKQYFSLYDWEVTDVSESEDEYRFRWRRAHGNGIIEYATVQLERVPYGSGYRLSILKGGEKYLSYNEIDSVNTFLKFTTALLNEKYD